MTIFIYSEAEEALRRGFPFATAYPVPVQSGPPRREDAERRTQEELRLHELLIERIKHAAPCERSKIAYAREVLRIPVGRAGDPQHEVEGKDIVLFVREDYSIVPHGQVWEGSMAMARWLCSHYHERLAKASRPCVLELGSGCGLPGIVLAALGAQVTLSDRSEGALANLVHNVHINLSSFPGPPPSVVRLDWSDPEAVLPVWAEALQSPPSSSSASQPPRLPAAPTSFDFIVGTEVVYSKEGAEHIIDTIKTWLVAPDGGQACHKDGGSFYLLQNPLRAGLRHFVSVLSAPGEVSERAKDIRRGLALEELDFDLRPPDGRVVSLAVGGEQELRLYRVRRV